MKQKGFTLAETLITLGIIGVVATLTLPNLMADYKKKTYVAQLQRTYNMISNAVEMLMVDQDVDNLSDTYLVDNDGPEKFLKQYFKVTKDCGVSSENNSCNAPGGYKAYDGSSIDNKQVAPSGYYCINVNTGATICMLDMRGYSEEGGYHSYSYMTIDINGVKAPNRNGRDRFFVNLYSDGKIADQYDNSSDYYDSRCEGLSSTEYGGACVDKIINDGWVMDY